MAVQLSIVLSNMQQLSWLNLPMVSATKPLLPLLAKLPALQQMYLQVSFIQHLCNQV
jgi:hypothetical protein